MIDCCCPHAAAENIGLTDRGVLADISLLERAPALVMLGGARQK